MPSALPIPATAHTAPTRRWRTSSIALITAFWAVLQLGGLFSPGLLDDVDSIYIQIAREMLQRHDFVTPTIDGVRFFDKPPLLYWMAAGSMHLFGVHDWAARLPLALGVLALLLAVYALGIRFYSPASHTSLGAPSVRAFADGWDASSPPPTIPNDRAALYAALALATCLGPYLYTRFYIPDILIALWMTLAVHSFLIALERANTDTYAKTLSPSGQDVILIDPRTNKNSVILSEARTNKNSVILSDPRTNKNSVILSAPRTNKNSVILSDPRTNKNSVILSEARSAQPKDPDTLRSATTLNPFLATNSALLPMLAFAAVTALNLLTKGLIGVIFPVAFALLYLAFTRQLNLLRKLHLIPSTLAFLAIAAPWHILAAIRNPPIPMPPGLGLPTRAGWAWFYLYNEHIARFLGHRIPHDYGQVPIPIFWALLLLWLLPWVAFLPAALRDAYETLRRRPHSDPNLRFDSDPNFSPTNSAGAPHLASEMWVSTDLPNHPREAAVSCLLWAAIILGFFTLSSRQEYYHLPALPALALLVGAFLASADRSLHNQTRALRASLYFLVPLGTLLFLLCTYLALTAPHHAPTTTLGDVLRSNPADYTLSLGHLFDLTGPAMGFFRAPLLTVALGMFTLGPIAYLVRRSASPTRPNRAFAANLLIAAAMTAVLLAAHEGLVRFYPILGSKDLALAIDRDLRPGDLILNDGELTSGSALLFYTPQSAAPIYLVNGRINGPWFGSFYPDAPKIFLNDADLARLWHGPKRLFLLTENPESRTTFLSPDGPVHIYATSGGKTILTNR